MQENTDYKKLLTEVIKRQIVILGPDITLVKARNVPELQIADDGTVLSVSGNPQVVTQKLVDQFMELSGQIVKKTMEPLLMQSAGNQTPVTTQVAQPTQPGVQPSNTPPNPGGNV